MLPLQKSPRSKGLIDMSETAFIFPGQGSQDPSMLQPFYDEWPEVRSEFEAIADDTVSDLVFNADAETLARTKHAQPAVFTVSLAVSQGIQQRYDFSPDFVAGHSLGHITAATAAGVLSAADARSLVNERGRLMGHAEEVAGPGTMIAILFAEPAVVDEVVAEYETVAVGGYNTPRQTVLSGLRADVEAAADDITQTADQARVVELDVESGFHSPVMEPAVEPFREITAELTFRDPTVPVVSDMTGEVYRSGDTARRAFRNQLRSPVRWVDVMSTLEARGVDRFVVVPPAEEVTKTVTRNVSSADVIGVTDIDIEPPVPES